MFEFKVIENLKPNKDLTGILFLYIHFTLCTKIDFSFTITFT